MSNMIIYQHGSEQEKEKRGREELHNKWDMKVSSKQEK